MYLRRFAGERFDAILDTNQHIGRYLVNIKGLGDCRNIVHKASLNYDGSTEALKGTPDVQFSHDEITKLEMGHDCNKVSENIVCALDMMGSDDESLRREEPEETIYVPFDVNSFADVTDEMTDYKYNIYEFTYYPAYLSLLPSGTRLAQINHMTFKYPSSPILSQPESSLDKMICSLGERSKFCENTPLFCECLQIFEVPPNKTIELLFIDEGFGSNVSHTFHVHGYNVSVVGLRSLGEPTSKEDIMALDREGLLSRNLVDPPKKDTFTVPNKGYAILRFHTDNLGYWLWEVRGTGTSPTLTGAGMQFLMRVGSRENLPTVPIDFPTCGNNKGPDMIFESNP